MDQIIAGIGITGLRITPLEAGIIFVCFVVMLFLCIHFWRIHRLTHSIASIITVLGILGTFVGIAYGLYRFDPQNIESSIPTLLGGLKIAFFTSIGGIFLSVVYKLRAAYKGRRAEEAGTQPSEPTINDLVDYLAKILDSQKEEAEKTRETLGSIENALTGGGESTVVTQLQKLRTTFSDKQDELIKSFDEFAKQMAENNTKALIEALEEVMRDFNAKINEQFGDNFKQLNQAVERILEWQEQYRQQMDELAREFQRAAESIERSKECLEVVAGQSDRIRENADKLEPILKGIDERQKALADHLSAFADMSEKAREVFPTIEKRLNELTSDLSECVKRVLKSIEDQGTQIQSMAETTNSNIETIMGRTGDNVESLVKRTAEVMEKQVSELDKELSSELTKSLQSLGSQLTSLSGKFVEDYTPLTDKLRDVVQMARRATNA